MTGLPAAVSPIRCDWLAGRHCFQSHKFRTECAPVYEALAGLSAEPPANGALPGKAPVRLFSGARETGSTSLLPRSR